MALCHILGYPRIGARRELKTALERRWAGQGSDGDLIATARDLRQAAWRAQREAGLDWLTAGDFSLYDHVLDAALDLGAVRRAAGGNGVSALDPYFALARGGPTGHALEMTKWFDTNYHYLVPELEAGQDFEPSADRLVEAVKSCSAISTSVKPVMLGPLSFLWLSKCRGEPFERSDLLPRLVEAYAHILAALRREGVEWVQIDEPALVLDLDPRWIEAYERALGRLRGGMPKLLLTTYFESLDVPPARVFRWPFAGIHLDLARAPGQLEPWLRSMPADWVLSAGVVDGRNVWRNELSASLDRLEPIHERLQDRLWVAASCSLLHVPLSLESESEIDARIRPWLAFAREKLDETKTLAAALNTGRAAVRDALDASDQAAQERRRARERPRPADAGEASTLRARRAEPFEARRGAQRTALRLPLLPTTTIGSFPQTADIRQARAAHRRGEIDTARYLDHMRAEIRRVVQRQEDLGLDVLVHGEPERNDMVEYFAQMLDGCAITSNGWVQSYGSRCVKPPIIHGDVSRPRALTVELTAYAQSLTPRVMKGMLTGPVTLLKWSFARDDIAPREVARQLALCVRLEVADLQEAGIRIVQIDEPAFREAMPLKRRDAPDYLDWSVAAFRLAASAAWPQTQVHTHMCYAEFGDILPAIAAMDADVVTLETSRSKMEILEAFRTFEYPNELGPGVYDIHSPRVPTVEEIETLLRRAAAVIPLSRLWVNPDCGLKTRGWEETQPALANMVEAARRLRALPS
jgi:5-methyltetrahydropteroyltriglutamate--homocysteine methyltransferase